MSKRLRFFLVLLALVLAGMFLYPSYDWYFNISQEKKEEAAKSRIDVRILTQEKAQEAVERLKVLNQEDPDQEIPDEFKFLIAEAREVYKARGLDIPRPWTIGNVVQDVFSSEKVLELLENKYRDELIMIKERSTEILQLGLDLSGGMSVLIDPVFTNSEGETPSQEVISEQLTTIIEIMKERADSSGLTEPVIRRTTENQIIVELPGEENEERVQNLIAGKGKLDFRVLNTEASTALQNALAINPSLIDASGNLTDPSLLPPDHVVMPVIEKDAYGVEEILNYWIVPNEVALEGKHLTDVEIRTDQLGRLILTFDLDSEGSGIFFQVTSANVEENLAVIMEDKIRAYARITEAIRGNVSIRGFNLEDAQNLQKILNTEVIPVDLQIKSVQSVGSSLGQESIEAGINAVVIGLVLVLAFMLIYYKGAGFIADIALLLNFVFILAILTQFGLTLTLTSIAGLILTVGMAVDANVIIFERIKEEYRLGKSVTASVEAGFKKAFWTIMDANITTFIAAIFLSMLGSGPVKGFAYTLAVGILSSMFTALFVSRLLFDFSIETFKVKKLSISWRKR
jgi:preprotein translocase subunit SecD